MKRHVSRTVRITIGIVGILLFVTPVFAQFLDSVRVGSIDRMFEGMIRVIAKNPALQYFTIIVGFWIIFYQVFTWGLSKAAADRFGDGKREGKMLAGVLAWFPTLFFIWLWRDTGTAAAVGKTMGWVGYVVGWMLVVAVFTIVYSTMKKIPVFGDPD